MARARPSSGGSTSIHGGRCRGRPCPRCRKPTPSRTMSTSRRARSSWCLSPRAATTSSLTLTLLRRAARPSSSWRRRWRASTQRTPRARATPCPRPSPSPRASARNTAPSPPRYWQCPHSPRRSCSTTRRRRAATQLLSSSSRSQHRRRRAPPATRPSPRSSRKAPSPPWCIRTRGGRRACSNKPSRWARDPSSCRRSTASTSPPTGPRSPPRPTTWRRRAAASASSA
mmetsp:Transcript_27183/g.79981  ORF Transcript_27183/g.79981 Transcript_27183/m.79981 type:complete len:228 (-) Transcript_27183:746-1429(-)